MSDKKEPLIKTVSEEESARIPPVAHEGGTPLEAVKSQEEERSEGRSVSWVTQVIPAEQTEDLILPPAKEEECAPETKSQDEVKEPEKVPEGAVTIAQVSSKALVRELVNRFVNFMKQ